MIYLDTSVLGAIFFREPGAANLVTILESQRKAKLMISAWTLTEMASIDCASDAPGSVARLPPCSIGFGYSTYPHPHAPQLSHIIQPQLVHSNAV